MCVCVCVVCVCVCDVCGVCVGVCAMFGCVCVVCVYVWVCLLVGVWCSSLSPSHSVKEKGRKEGTKEGRKKFLFHEVLCYVSISLCFVFADI